MTPDADAIQGDVMELDSMYRSISWERGDIDSALTSISTVEEEQTWGLDGANNIASTDDGSTTCTRSYNPGNQLIQEACGGSAETFWYDANGNLQRDDDFVYHWDFLNRLSYVERNTTDGPEPFEAFGYDAAGRRITKVFAQEVDIGAFGTFDARTESWFTYVGPNVVQESQPVEWSSDPSGGSLSPLVNVVRQFTYGSGVDEVLEMTVDGNNDGDTVDAGDPRYHYHYDSQGSVIGLTDEAGHLVEGYTYTPFGEVSIRVPGSGNDDVQWDGNDTVLVLARSPAGNPYMYTGQRWDPETETYHYRARQYDPDMGRFLSRDPIGVWGDQANLGNPYAYVGNRPWQFTDSSGQCPTCLVGAVIGAAVGAGLYVGGAIANDADTSLSGLGKAVGIGATGGALIGTGVGISAGAGAFATIGGASLAGAGQGLLATETFDALDDGTINAGVGTYATSAAAGGAIGGVGAGIGAGINSLAAPGIRTALVRSAVGCGIGAGFNGVMSGGSGSMASYAGSCAGGAIAGGPASTSGTLARLQSGAARGLIAGLADTIATQSINLGVTRGQCTFDSMAFATTLGIYTASGAAVGGANPRLRTTPNWAQEVYGHHVGVTVGGYGLLANVATSNPSLGSCAA